MYTYLLVVQAIIAAALVGVILLQRSEGGGFTGGGSPAGLMSARGAADFLTRTTAILATLFIAMCILLAAIAGYGRGGKGTVDTSIKRESGTGASLNAQVDPPAGVSVNQTAPAQQLSPEQQAAMARQQQLQMEAARAEAARNDALRQQQAQIDAENARRRAAAPKMNVPTVKAPEVGASTPRITKITPTPEKAPAPAAEAPAPAPAPAGNAAETPKTL